MRRAWAILLLLCPTLAGAWQEATPTPFALAQMVVVRRPAAVAAPTATATAASGTNCPSSLPTPNTTESGDDNQLVGTGNCTTGANGAGYTLQSMKIPITTAGGLVRCSIFTLSGTTITEVDGTDCRSCNAINCGADTTTACGGSCSGQTLILTPGAVCDLAASTRYWVICNSSSATLAWGFVTTPNDSFFSGTGGGAFDYDTTSWPAGNTTGATGTGRFASYMVVVAK